MSTFAPSPISNWNSVFSHPQFLCFLRRFMPFGVAYFSGRIYKIYTAVARVCVGWKSGRGKLEARGTAAHVSSVRLVKFPVFSRTCCSLWLCWKTAVQVEPPTFPHSQFRTWFTNFGITFFPTRFSFLTRTRCWFLFLWHYFVPSTNSLCGLCCRNGFSSTFGWIFHAFPRPTPVGFVFEFRKN